MTKYIGNNVVGVCTHEVCSKTLLGTCFSNQLCLQLQVMRKVQIYFGLSLLTVKMKQNWDCTTYCNHILHRYLHSTHILLGFHAAQKAFLSTDTYQGQVYFTKGSFFNYVDKMRKVSHTENVNYMKIFTYNSKGIPSPKSIVGKILST